MTTAISSRGPDAAEVKRVVDDYIAGLSDRLLDLNKTIHSHPELAYQEHHAHDAICDFLESLGLTVTRHAYGLATAFEVVTGSATNGRLVTFNAEYDALPGIGHACGHNLIATAGVTGFIALAHALDKFGIDGRVKLLGTPAEEDGGGKIDLIKAGAYSGADVSLMIHPSSDEYFSDGFLGWAGTTSMACYDLVCTYTGVSAHAAIAPWDGVNALDALVAAYNNISMLRQQIRPTDRVHGAIMEAPKITNAIPALAVTKYTIRSKTMKEVRELGARVRRCLEAGALATGCGIELEETPAYADLRVNASLCAEFQARMGDLGVSVMVADKTAAGGSTDQGNVSYEVPALHAVVGIPTTEKSLPHTPGFTTAAGTSEAHLRTLDSAKGMALTGWNILVDDTLHGRIVEDFARDKQDR